jgi:hypothetical protein
MGVASRLLLHGENLSDQQCHLLFNPLDAQRVHAASLDRLPHHTMIPFPTGSERLNYVETAWTDPVTGKQWLYNPTKSRWESYLEVITWNTLEGKPEEFPAEIHEHTLADVTDAGTAAAENVGYFATAAQGATADTAVQTSQLSLTGGANKVPQYSADGTLITGTLLPDATPGAYSATGAGNIIFPDARGLVGRTSEGTFLWNQYYSDAHDAGGGELYFSGRNRVCFNWGGSVSGDACFQLGSVGRSKEWVMMQAHGTGTVGDPIRESKAFVWRGNHYNAGTPLNAWIGSQYVPATGTTGEVKFNHIAGDVPHDANGRLNGTHVFSIADTGPKIATGKVITFGDGSTMATASGGGGGGTVTSFSAGTTGFSVANATTTPTLSGTLAVTNGGTGTTTGSITPTGDYTITQNSVPAIVSVGTGAITNTLRVELGRLRVGDSGATGTNGVPFEVRSSLDAASGATVGSFYVDSSGVVRAGRLSATGGATSGRIIVQDRTGASIFDLNSITAVATINGALTTSGISTFSNTTDSTSPTTGALKITGGLGVAKNIVAGAVIRLKGYTVAGLPAGTEGDTAYVTDGVAVPVYGATAAGGGSTRTPVFYNGSSWVNH